jgi:carbon monoxide dehydrogenase subunit G
MKIDNKFTVGAPIDRAWEVLTDLEGIAPCLPGAQLTGVDGDVYSGKVKIKVGPVTSEYAGTARFLEKDEADHRAVISASGRDSRGAGNASATITARLLADGAQTVVSVDTDLKINGKIAQFGSGMIKEISEKLLGQFAQSLEGKLVAPAADSAEPGAEAAAAPVASPATTAPVATAVPPVSEAPATAAVATTTVRDTGRPATNGTAPSAAATSAAATAGTATTGAAASRTITPDREVEALDLMAVAGGSIYKRLVPIIVLVVIVAAIVIYFVVK